jgi:S-disulfanyl-L-cysteine oxidoreductase SoxD
MRIRTIRWLCPALCGAILGISSIDAAQKKAPPSKIATTSSGVYTPGQASRGEQTYMSICVACHPAGTYTAPAFREKWNGALLSDLFGLVSQTMPKMEPGSLAPEEYADVVAYMLKINGAPTGKRELPADAKALKKIRISMPRSR